MKDCSFLILWSEKYKYIVKKVRGKIIDENLSCYKTAPGGDVQIIHRKTGLPLRRVEYYNQITPDLISDVYVTLSRAWPSEVERWEEIFNRAVDEYHKNTN